MKVVDTSALYDVLMNSPRADAIRGHLDDELLAPDLMVSEILNLLRRDLLRTTLSHERARAAMDVFLAADIEFRPTWSYAERIWELRDNVTAYDACYVALAEDLGCPLLTADARLGRAPGLRAPVILV